MFHGSNVSTSSGAAVSTEPSFTYVMRSGLPDENSIWYADDPDSHDTVTLGENHRRLGEQTEA